MYLYMYICAYSVAETIEKKIWEKICGKTLTTEVKVEAEVFINKSVILIFY